jgi:hypothetical protein
VSDYYVDGAVGNDSNAGTSEGAGNAWATIGKAIIAPIAPGDRLFIKASASYAEDNDFSTTSGTATSPIVLEGYTTTVGDGGRATIPGNGGSRTLRTGAFYSVRNLVVTKDNSGGSSAGILLEGTSIAENCEVDGLSTSGRGFENAVGTYHVGCYAHDCNTAGFRFFGIGGAFSCVTDTCSVGFANNVGTLGYFYCIAINSNSTGFQMNSNGDNEPMINCTVDGEDLGGTGYVNGTSGGVSKVINCVATRCNVGMQGSASSATERTLSSNNCLFGNTSDYSGGQVAAPNEITTDPTFVDQDSNDYGPDTGSPLIFGGLDMTAATWFAMTGDPIDVGALQSLPSAANIAGAFLNWGVN